MSCEISIIVPVYNVEKYLEKCINSILNQSFEDFEIIIVNDGSTDSSGEIANSLLTRDNRIKVINKENGGLSTARNAGLDVANGNYIGFIDSDDTISPQMYERLYKNIKDTDKDISMCRMLRVEKDKQYPTKDFIGKEVLSSDECLKLLFLNKIDQSVCNKLFKKKLFQDLRFPEGKINEDFSILYRLFNRSMQIGYISKLDYIYYYRSNSITKSNISNKIFDRYYNAQESVEFVRDKEENIQKAAEYYLFYTSFCVLKEVLLSGNRRKFLKEYREIESFLKNNYNTIANNSYIDKKFKHSFIYLLFFRNLYSLKEKLFS